MRLIGLPLLRVLLIFTTLCITGAAFGHALQPGYLELRLLSADQYAVVWKTPAVAGRPMAIRAHLPEQCDPRSAATPAWDGSAYVSRWTTHCRGGLEGGRIAIDGLPLTSTDVLVRYDLSNGDPQSQRLTPGQAHFTVPTEPDGLEVVKTYLLLGVEHILSGVDHLLFVLALLILVNGARRLIATVTAFTVAHSLTLAGATLGLVQVPGPPVEAVIALSILFVAAEILHSRQGRIGLTERYPWLVAFIFGLLHGFGFAGALAQIGLPQSAIPIALLFFNVGVELGQLLFIAAMLGAMALSRRLGRVLGLELPQWAGAAPPYVIGSISAFWVWQRIAAFA
jgi:hydrogenase/urease accessory protein HupE